LKKLLFVTGTRADFGKLEPLASAAVKNGYSVTFFVTGMHMIERYGLTKEEVHRNKIFDVVEFINQRSGDPLDIILSKTIIGFSDFVKEFKPDLVLVHGDRIEALASCIVCSTNYIRCIHIEGGEVSGTIDEQFRHCNTKLASDHLVSSSSARERILRLGENENAVHVIGSPELDIHSQDSGVSMNQVRERYSIRAEDYGICIFHPVTSELDTIGLQAKKLFGCLKTSNQYFVVILPNNDPGSSHILKEIEELSKDQFRVLPSIRFNYFSELMKNASIIVGNSSMGVREAPFLGIPSINIGSRQLNRSTASSIQHINGNNLSMLNEILENFWGKSYPRSEQFGDGGSCDAFIKILESGKLWKKPPQKYFVD
jgi:UDP-N-acetylglucosamine 2-epimerase (hydrolysing)